jgi:hypothetical protein
MNIKEFFTKNRSIPPIVFGVPLLVLVSYYFFIAISNPQPVVDIDNVLEENAIVLAHGKVIMEKIQSFEDSLVRGDEGEMHEAGEEILRLKEEFIRKTNEQALLSKEREKHRSATIQRANWDRVILWGILLLIVASILLIDYKKKRGGVDVSRFKDEKTVP